jgi:hypothetical protein
MDSNGTTIAILPSPLNNILPKKIKIWHFKLLKMVDCLLVNMGMILKIQWS